MNSEFEKEIDIRELGYSILRHWRSILLAALSLGILLGGYKFYHEINIYHPKNADEQANTIFTQSEQDYENTKSNLQQEIASLENALRSTDDYNHDSILMNMDPYNVYESTANVYIKTDYAILPDKVYQNPDYTDSVVSSYILFLLKDSAIKEMSAQLNIDTAYLKELIKISADPNTRIIHINVVHSEKNISESILKQLLEQLQSKKPELEAEIGPHTVSILMESTEKVVKKDIADMQKQQIAACQELQKTLKEKEKELTSLRRPVEPNIIIINALVKYTIMGSILGIFLTCFVLCLLFINNSKVVSAEELKKLYKFKVYELSIDVLSPPPPLSSKTCLGSCLDAKIKHLFTKRTLFTAWAVYKLITSEMKSSSGNEQKLLIIGSAESDIKEKIAEGLTKCLSDTEVIVCQSDNFSSETIENLSNCSHILLIEQCYHSSFKDISQEMDVISNVHQKLLGCVLVE